MNTLKATGLSAVLFLVTLLATDTTLAQTSNYSPQVGQPHPDFILPSIDDGKPIQFSALRGKKVLLMHFASW